LFLQSGDGCFDLPGAVHTAIDARKSPQWITVASFLS
jgi:hypothetical protein